MPLQLNTLLSFLREGDELVITRIDRLARSIIDLKQIAAILNKKGITLKATEQAVDTSSSAGKCFFDMLGVFAEFETNLRRERQMEGIVHVSVEIDRLFRFNPIVYFGLKRSSISVLSEQI